MTILDTAISREGGVGKLATALGIRQSRVSNWRSRQRIPEGWERALLLRYGDGVENQPQAPASQALAATENVAVEVQDA